MANFSDWLVTQLKIRSMSPADLARASNKAPAVISRILSGERNPAPETIKDIAYALRLPPELVFMASVGVEKNDELSPRKRELLQLAEDAEDSDVELVIAMLEAAVKRKHKK